MKSSDSASTLRAATRATLGTLAIFVITSVHHVYGAYIYNTPWRVHAAIVSGVATTLIVPSLWLMRRPSSGSVEAVASWAFIVLTFLIPFLGFGVLEGTYNHAFKDALYFSNASPGLKMRLFPPPTYEMPNNAFFEVTGVMHVVPGFVTGYYLYQFVRLRQQLHRTAPNVRASAA